MALEQPEYTVERSKNGIEFRRYEPYWVAECDRRDIADLRGASNSGFRYLFNYISGENTARQKVSMTVPVQQQPSGSGWAISFVIPREFYKDGAPQPSNPAVAIRQVPGGLVAAHRFRGVWGSDTFEQKSAKLLADLASQGLEPDGDVFSAVYNPPFTPPLLRRNEVLVRIKEPK